MAKFVQAFFFIFIKTIFFFVFFNSCNSIQYISYSQSSCLKNHILPNLSLFDYSPVSSTLLKPECEILNENHSHLPNVIDGFSFSTFITIPSECIFEENLIPKQILSKNPHILLWDYTHNEFLDFWLLYQDKKPCGFLIFPRSKFSDSSYYLFIMKKTFFTNFLKNKYKKDELKLWDHFKNRNSLKQLNENHVNLIKSIIESYKNLYSFHPDESIYTIFPIRSVHGLFAPFLDYMDKRKQWISIDIYNKIFMKDYIPKEEGNVYKIQFREKLINSNYNSTDIIYAGISSFNYPLKRNYENSIYIYIPANINKNKLNIIIVNGNIIKIPSFRKIGQQSNSIIISYFIFKNPYLNLLNDIIIYENINKIIDVYLKEFKIHNIYKICIQDQECVISTFYENNIKDVIIYDIPLLNSTNFSYNQIKSILNLLNFSDEKIILNTLSRQLKDDIVDYSLYLKYKDKLKEYLNYNFTIYEFSFSFVNFHVNEIIDIINRK